MGEKWLMCAQISVPSAALEKKKVPHSNRVFFFHYIADRFFFLGNLVGKVKVH